MSVDWDFGDQTVSSVIPACKPFKPGRSQIGRRFSTTHTYASPGRYVVRLALTNGGRVLLSARTTVEVR